MKKRIFILVISFIVWGVLSRTIFHLGPNVEFITAISISCGLLIKNKKIAFSVPIFVMFLSDLIIGNTRIFLFTWSAFLIPVLTGFVVSKLLNKTSNKKYLKLTILSEAAGITSTIFFFVWTNFGHWLTTNMYAKDIYGLVECYVNAIPFLKPQLAGNLIIVPMLILASFYVVNLSVNKDQKLANA